MDPVTHSQFIDQPVNCSAAQYHLKGQYDKSTRLTVGDDVFINLYDKDVITHDEKIKMGELKEQKRMEYLLDHIIIEIS